jgi:preprotein translocase subunit YajC
VDLLIFLAIMMLFIWGFMILPQQRRQKRHQEMINSIQVGDELLITAGIYGTVTDIFDDDFFLEVAPGVEIRIASAAVAMKIDFEDDTAAGDPAEDD